MNYLFITWTMLLGILSPILCFFKARKYVLYTFAIFCVLSPTIFGFMASVNMLIAGRLWSVLDVQFLVLVLLAYPLSRKEVQGRAFSWVDRAMFILTCLVMLNFVVGYFRLGQVGGVLNITRYFMSIPVYFAAANILSNPENIKKFYRWILWFTIFLLGFHLVVMFKIYLPPLYQAAFRRFEEEQFLQYFRPTLFFYQFFYITSACVAIGFIQYSRSGKLLARVALVAAAVGTLLSQTRTMYGGMFLVFLGVVCLGKGRIKMLIISVVVLAILFVVVKVAADAGVDILFRFRSARLPEYKGSWRGAEKLSLIEAIERNPAGIMTGQGFGVSHGSRGWAPVAYFHNEYLANIFALGIIGFMCYIYVIASSIIRGHKYCGDPEMALLLMPVRLAIFAGAGMAVFFPILWVYKGCAIVACLIAISRNSDYLAYQVYSDEELISGEYSEIQDSDIYILS